MIDRFPNSGARPLSVSGSDANGSPIRGSCTFAQFGVQSVIIPVLLDQPYLQADCTVRDRSDPSTSIIIVVGTGTVGASAATPPGQLSGTENFVADYEVEP